MLFNVRMHQPAEKQGALTAGWHAVENGQAAARFTSSWRGPDVLVCTTKVWQFTLPLVCSISAVAATRFKGLDSFFVALLLWILKMTFPATATASVSNCYSFLFFSINYTGTSKVLSHSLSRATRALEKENEKKKGNIYIDMLSRAS